MPGVKRNVVKWSSSNLTNYHGSANAPNFRARREQCGATQSEIAKACDVTVQTVKNWEKGKTSIPEIAFTVLDWFERSFDIAEKLVKDFEFSAASIGNAVRIPFFRSLGELVWWVSTLKYPITSPLAYSMTSFAQIFVCPWFYDSFKEDPLNSDNFMRSGFAEVDAQEMDELFGLIDELFYEEPEKFAASIAKETSIGRVNKFFEVVASALEARGLSYTWYYLDSLNDFTEIHALAPFFEERDGLGSNEDSALLPIETAAETASDYDRLLASRLSKGTVSGSCVWAIDNEGVLRVKPKYRGQLGVLGDTSEWGNYRSEITRVEIVGHVLAPRVCRCMFESFDFLRSADLSGFDTSNVQDMSAMFCGCSSLESLDLSTFDTSRVTDMSQMFMFCDSLASLNLSGFNTSKVTNMECMFVNCRSLNQLDLSSFDISNVKNLDYMFNGTPQQMTLDKHGEEILSKVYFN